MSAVRDDVTLALQLADQADTLTLDRFGALDLRVDTKPDLTPVTDADRSAETVLRDALAKHRPDDPILGEEYGGTTVFSGRQWVIDPIDGTKNFVRGVPVWATLIALLRDGVPVVGVVSAPALQRRWWAGDGEGAFVSVAGGAPRRISVSSVTDIESASLSLSSFTGWANAGAARSPDRPHGHRLAGTGLRRLLVLLPRRRGRGRYRGRTGGVAVGPRCPGHPGARSRRRVHQPRRRGRATRRQRRCHQRAAALRRAEQAFSGVT